VQTREVGRRKVERNTEGTLSLKLEKWVDLQKVTEASWIRIIRNVESSWKQVLIQMWQHILAGLTQGWLTGPLRVFGVQGDETLTERKCSPVRSNIREAI